MWKAALPDNVKHWFGEKKFLIALVFGVFVVIMFPMLRAQQNTVGGYRAASSMNYRELQNYDLDALIEKFHETMNEKVNERIAWFTEATPEELREREKIPERNPDTQELGACPDKATSAFCLSRFLVDEYAAFREELMERARNAYSEAQKQASERDLERGDLQSLVSESSDVVSKINREIAQTEKTIDMTLAAYHELHMAWPLHQKYQEVIDAMEEYRSNLADMRSSLELFPSTFHNVSTAQCT